MSPFSSDASQRAPIWPFAHVSEGVIPEFAAATGAGAFLPSAGSVNVLMLTGAPAGAGKGYILDEVGFTSFVLVAARRPLPPFAEWQPTIDAA